MLVQIEGRVYMPPGGGQSTARTSSTAHDLLCVLIDDVEQGRNWVLANGRWISSELAKRGRKIDCLPLEVQVDGLTVWFVDEAAQVQMCPRRGELRIGQGALIFGPPVGEML